jgi:DnaJ homolog subfamily C member 19
MKRTAQLTGTSSFVHYYRGGFDSKMSRREASLVLGLREGASKDAIKDAHRRIMIANHPDRGGSPYLATKINEAKDTLEGKIKNV